jgi:hypothetical protein
MTQNLVARSRDLGSRSIRAVQALGGGLKRGIVRGAAITAMLVIYAVGSIASIGSSALGVAGVSSLALTATATPADAWRRRRRRRRRGFRFRGFRGWAWDWGHRRRRRRRRRRRGFNLYLRF